MPNLKEHMAPIIITSLFVLIAIASHILLNILPKQENLMAQVGGSIGQVYFSVKNMTADYGLIK